MALDIYDYRSIYNIDMTMSKADRSMYRQSSPNHAMVFVGVDVKDGKPVKWLVENSWGTDKGDGGYWAMYDTWFDNHVYNVIVKREYVSDDVLAIYDQDPIILPPWDPMYSLIRE
jgi:bleomycin hydrolase